MILGPLQSMATRCLANKWRFRQYYGKALFVAPELPVPQLLYLLNTVTLYRQRFKYIVVARVAWR